MLTCAVAKPVVIHVFYMDETDLTKVRHLYESVGPAVSWNFSAGGLTDPSGSNKRSADDTADISNEPGQQLQVWRAARGKSQLDIFLDSGI
jgi:hypothetical protein